MGLNEDYERRRVYEENRLLERWMGMSRKRRRELRREQRRILRRYGYLDEQKPGMFQGDWRLWDPRGWDLVSVVVWVLILVGGGWFWWLVIRRIWGG